MTPLDRPVRHAPLGSPGGKGSHRKYEPQKGARVTVAGKAGDDAKHYQEKLVRKAIQESQK
jgi:predicted RNA binding protein YcfA (HicA-like mRNA interferase family)